MILMKNFNEEKGAVLRTSFSKGSFNMPAAHVLVITSYNNKWLLTKHKERGLEFPGGKAEKGESIEDAALREVREETGGEIERMTFLGEYELTLNNARYVKAVFFAEVSKLVQKESYLETDGPELVEGNILQKRFEHQYSYIMQDEVLEVFLRRRQTLL